MKRYTWFLSFLFISCTLSLSQPSQPNLNLDFEAPGVAGLPPVWQFHQATQTNNQPDKYIMQLDSQVVHSGHYSMSMHSHVLAPDKADDQSMWLLLFPAKNSQWKKIHFSGYIKTDSVAKAGLFLNIEGAKYSPLVSDTANGAAQGTTDWKRYDLDLSIDPSAEYIFVGLYIEGNGAAWFDDLGIDIDGVPYGK